MKALREAGLMLGWLAGLALLSLVVLSCRVSASTPESAVLTTAVWNEIQYGPDLPDSLKNRPRKNAASQPYGDDDDIDRRIAEMTDVQAMQWAMERWMPHECILVFEQDHRRCPPCKAFHEGAAVELFKAGWELRTFRVDWERDRLFVEYFDISVTPTIVALVGGREVGRIEGNAPWRDVQKLFPRLNHANNAIAQQPPRQRTQEWSDCRQYRTGQWTWPGNTIASLRRHLSGPPHNMSRDWCFSASPNQLIATHDAWHNAHGPSGGRRAARRMRRTDLEQPPEILTL